MCLRKIFNNTLKCNRYLTNTGFNWSSEYQVYPHLFCMRNSTLIFHATYPVRVIRRFTFVWVNSDFILKEIVVGRSWWGCIASCFSNGRSEKILCYGILFSLFCVSYAPVESKLDTRIRVYNLNCVTKTLIFKCLNINWSYEYFFSFLLIINFNFLSCIKLEFQI